MLLKYSGAPNSLALEQVLEAERLGYDSVWSGEAYGTDAVTPTAWILARTTRIRAGTGIMQMQARTPACTAMTALTLQALSNNRFLLGIGASGPQVVEGWHGVPFGKPMVRTREYIEILRKILKREAASARWRALPDSLQGAGCDRPRQAAEEHPAWRSEHADLCCFDHADRAQDGGRSGRRRAADLHVAGED